MTKERLEILLVNALEWIEECISDFGASTEQDYWWFENEIGIDKDEFEELGMRLSDYKEEE